MSMYHLKMQRIDHITLDPNPFVKLSENEPEIPVFQTVFSRISGEEFICVRKDFSGKDGQKLVFRDFNENQNPRNDDDLKINDGNKIKKVKSALRMITKTAIYFLIKTDLLI